MKKGIIVAILFVLLSTTLTYSVEAETYDEVKFIPCLAEDGTYKLTIQVGYLGQTVVEPPSVYGSLSENVRIRQDGGTWNYYSYRRGGLVLKYGNLLAGTKFEVEILHFYDFAGINKTDIHIPIVYSITLEGPDIPPCYKKCTGDPVFKMFLLTRPDSYCIIISDVHPSVESQKALCFPGTDWVATRTACEGWVCNNNCWDCDYLGFERLSISELNKIHLRRMGLSE